MPKLSSSLITIRHFQICSERSILVTILIILAIFPASACRLPRWRGPSVTDFATARRLSQQAQRAARAGRWEEAENGFRAAIKRCPQDPQHHQHYGDFLLLANRTEEALREYLEACQLAVDDPQVRLKAADLASRAGQWELARRLVEEAIALQPTLAPAWSLHGKIAAATGRYQQALESFSRALNLAPDDHDVRLELARVHRQLGEPHKALVVCQAISSAFLPGDIPAEVSYELALDYLQLGRRTEAIEVLLAAKAIYPEDARFEKLLAAVAETESPVSTAEQTAAVPQMASGLASPSSLFAGQSKPAPGKPQAGTVLR
jgi:tetratricopeptide (TPR) repeat protein